MKLSEISTDKAIDVLCDITPSVNNIVTDENLLEQLKNKVKIAGDESKAEVIAIGVEKINKIVPIVLKSHREDILYILSAINGIGVDEIKKQNVIKTMKMIKELIQDKEFVDFFKSCAE